MELTTQQIQEIEHYLNVKDIVYVDLRPEVLDHIVSEIEEKMELEKVTFHNAFATSKQKWNAQLQETTSMFFGLGFSAPKIVIQKAKKVYWKQYLLLFFIITKYIIGFSLLAFFYMLFFKNRNVKTTYGFILKSQSLGVLTGLFVFLIIINRLKELNGIHVGMICSYLFVTYSYYTFFKKHKEAIVKHQIS